MSGALVWALARDSVVEAILAVVFVSLVRLGAFTGHLGSAIRRRIVAIWPLGPVLSNMGVAANPSQLSQEPVGRHQLFLLFEGDLQSELRLFTACVEVQSVCSGRAWALSLDRRRRRSSGMMPLASQGLAFATWPACVCIFLSALSRATGSSSVVVVFSCKLRFRLRRFMRRERWRR